MGVLVKKAKQLQEAATQFEQRQISADLQTALQSRLGQIEPLKRELSRCLIAHQLISETGVTVGVPKTELRHAADRLQVLLIQFDDKPEVIKEPNALDVSSLSSLIKKCLNALFESWKTFVSPPGEGDPLVQVLSRFDSLKASASDLADVRLMLRQLAQQLPKSRSDVAKALKLKKRQIELLKSFSDSGLDAEVEDFLSRASSGVPLAELIERPKLMKWIKEQNLLDSFIVRG
jgi:hypothetical protein